MNHGSRFQLPLPPATRALLLVNLAVFALNAVSLGRIGNWLAFSWSGVFDGYGLGAARVIGYQFAHSFADPMHLLMNMVALWVFGPLVEQRLGRTGIWRLYLWAGFAGAIGHVLLSVLQGQPDRGVVGASGACYGLLVYAACVAPRTSIVFVIVQMPLWVLASLLVALGGYQTFVDLATGGASHVSHSAHLGGALLGFVAHRLGWFGDDLRVGARPGPLARFVAGLRARAAARAFAAQQAAEQRLDAVLAKVKAEGLSSLRPDERAVLARESSRAQKEHGSR